MTNPFALAHRDGLPDALRVLVQDFPRDAWSAHPNYSQLIEFWLSRHMMFRRLLTQLQSDARSTLDKQIDPQTYKGRLHRFGGMLVNELHGHHTMEDTHYFPVMAQLDSRAAHGFEILDSDHHDMDAQLHLLTQGANATLQSGDDHSVLEGTAAFNDLLTRFAPLLDRHLEDEEDLVVPVLLKHAPAQFQ